jgi:hypothetical protein
MIPRCGSCLQEIGRAFVIRNSIDGSAWRRCSSCSRPIRIDPPYIVADLRRDSGDPYLLYVIDPDADTNAQFFWAETLTRDLLRAEPFSLPGHIMFKPGLSHPFDDVFMQPWVCEPDSVDFLLAHINREQLDGEMVLRRLGAPVSAHIAVSDRLGSQKGSSLSIRVLLSLQQAVMGSSGDSILDKINMHSEFTTPQMAIVIQYQVKRFAGRYLDQQRFAWIGELAFAKSVKGQIDYADITGSRFYDGIRFNDVAWPDDLKKTVFNLAWDEYSLANADDSRKAQLVELLIQLIDRLEGHPQLQEYSLAYCAALRGLIGVLLETEASSLPEWQIGALRRCDRAIELLQAGPSEEAAEIPHLIRLRSEAWLNLALGNREHNARKALADAKVAFEELSLLQGVQGVSSLRALGVLLRAYAVLIKFSGFSVKGAEHYAAIAADILDQADCDDDLLASPLRATLAQLLFELCMVSSNDEDRAALIGKSVQYFKDYITSISANSHARATRMATLAACGAVEAGLEGLSGSVLPEPMADGVPGWLDELVITWLSPDARFYGGAIGARCMSVAARWSLYRGREDQCIGHVQDGIEYTTEVVSHSPTLGGRVAAREAWVDLPICGAVALARVGDQVGAVRLLQDAYASGSSLLAASGLTADSSWDVPWFGILKQEDLDRFSASSQSLVDWFGRRSDSDASAIQGRGAVPIVEEFAGSGHPIAFVGIIGNLAFIVSTDSQARQWFWEYPIEAGEIKKALSRWAAALSAPAFMPAGASAISELLQPLLAPLSECLRGIDQELTEGRERILRLAPVGDIAGVPIHRCGSGARGPGLVVALPKMQGQRRARDRAVRRVAVLTDSKVDLPYAKMEGLNVSALFGRHGIPCAISEGSDASSSSFFEALRDSDIVHLAVHGKADDDDPLSSGVAMSDQTVGPRSLLSAEREITSSLVYLSCCASGVPSMRRARSEMFGLAYALGAMGVQNIVACMWPTPDLAAMFTADFFYRDLLESTIELSTERVYRALDRAVQQIRSASSDSLLWHLADIQSRTDLDVGASAADASQWLAATQPVPFINEFNWGSFVVLAGSSSG